MSNRSYPADFSRPLREVPVATDEDVARMLERLRRRCKVGKVSVNDSSAQRTEDQPQGNTPSNVSAVANQSQGSGMVPREAHNLERTGSIPAPATSLAPASSAGPPSPASASVVSGAAEITATAGGGPHEAVPSSPPFQPTRSAPNISPRSLEERHPNSTRTHAGSNPAGEARNQAGPAPSDAVTQVPTPRGNLPNSLGVGPGSGCEQVPDGSSCSLAPSAPALQWERISPTAMRTTCGTWTCCKVIVGGYPRYELWKRIAGLERPVCVQRGMTAFLEAQDMAEAESCV